jgi:hypothetical protein
MKVDQLDRSCGMSCSRQVVARPGDKWGKTPCAFVTLEPGATASDQD